LLGEKRGGANSRDASGGRGANSRAASISTHYNFVLSYPMNKLLCESIVYCDFY
jgi:hypothetical protein